MCGNRRRKRGGNITMNPAKYKSVSMHKETWSIATRLANKILPYGKVSRSEIVRIAINRLNQEVFKNEVSFEALKQTNEVVHASDN